MSVFQKAMVWLGLQDEDGYSSIEEDSFANADSPNISAPSQNPIEENSLQMRQAPTLKVARPTTIRPISQGSSVSVKKRTTSSSVNVVEPKGFNDAQQIGECLKQAKPVIVNLQNISKDLQRRLIDFSSGLTYGLDGSMSRVAENVFLITPSDVEVSDEDKQNLTAQGLYNI